MGARLKLKRSPRSFRGIVVGQGTVDVTGVGVVTLEMPPLLPIVNHLKTTR